MSAFATRKKSRFFQPTPLLDSPCLFPLLFCAGRERAQARAMARGWAMARARAMARGRGGDRDGRGMGNEVSGPNGFFQPTPLLDSPCLFPLLIHALARAVAPSPVPLHACIHACMRPCMHASMHACVHTCMRPCMHASMHASMQGGGRWRNGASKGNGERARRGRGEHWRDGVSYGASGGGLARGTNEDAVAVMAARRTWAATARSRR